ncbi:malate/lactate/ureidoglycolate dehydrogenase [Candidatus Wolfebacteria bacterium]|nr:malate/lactate/ureidoglycolate dehydrogenase [Candidatus Wolfebacteria bacterium]
MKINYENVKKITARIFALAGSELREAELIAKHLVEANLTGHDSHGVMRVSHYIKWLHEKRIFVNKHVETVIKGDTFAVLDGNFGFGQVIGEEAVAIGITMAQKNGLGIVGLRNSGHLGRIGDWAEMAAEAGLISIHFVNGNGYAILAAPFGGTDKRLSSNPICVGIPRGTDPMILLDMATCKISQGKIMMAKNKGEKLPEDTILDFNGKPTCDPNLLGAILPLSPGYKGFGLSFICEILAGALTGGDTSSPASPTVHCVGNGMLSIYIDQKRFGDNDKFLAEIDKLTAWVKASPTITSDGEILLPGEPEQKARVERLRDGITLDEETLRQFVETAKSVGVKDEEINFLNI